MNRLIGDERVIASEKPGTTRDSILVPFRKDERDFVLIDTAGVRRRSKVEDVVERVSVAKTLQAIDEAHVVILVLDAHDAIAEQDASVLGQALERGRALIIAVNKWDGIADEQREQIRRQLDLKLDFVPFAPKLFISARHGTGVGELVRAAVRAHDAAFREMSTPPLTRTLEQALQAHQPPLVRGRRIKLRYAHQGGKNPPRIIVHGNQTDLRAGGLSALSGQRLPQDVRSVRHARGGRVSHRRESLRAPQAPLRSAERRVFGAGREEQCRVDSPLVEHHAPVQMRAGDATRSRRPCR